MKTSPPRTFHVKQGLEISYITGVAVIFSAVFAGLIIHFQYWFLYADGLTAATKTSPFMDFNNLWSGSKMVLNGHIDWLFDVDLYRAELRRTINPNIPNHEWGYPPSILLIGVPLALLPELAAYLIWTFGTIALFYLTVRTLNLSKFSTLVITLSPAIIFNTTLGQNGALIGALIIAGLSLTPKRPILAGICFGLLTIKPQFGLLIPFILLASRSWQVIIAACLTTLTLVITSGLFFGFESWQMFFNYTQPFMRDVMEAPFMQPHHVGSVTIFVAMRGLGMSLASAYTIQALTAFLCISYAAWIWRKHSQMDHRVRVAITCMLIILATPYGYTYDLTPVAAAIGIIFTVSDKLKLAPIFGLLWLLPLINAPIAFQLGMSYYGYLLIILFGLMLWSLRSSKVSLVN